MHRMLQLLQLLPIRSDFWTLIFASGRSGNQRTAESPEARLFHATHTLTTRLGEIWWYPIQHNTNTTLRKQELPTLARSFTPHSFLKQEFRTTESMGFFGSSKPVKAQRKGPDGKVRKRRREPLREKDAVGELVLPMDITCNVSVPDDDWSDISMPSESGKKKKNLLQRIFSKPGNFRNKTDYSFRT